MNYRVVLIGIACVSVAGCGANADAGKADGATVARVIDGDTIETESGERVRVLGIDTPEVYGGTECWGPEASSFAKQLLEDKVVTLRADPTQDDADRYDRLLRYIVLQDGRNYSVVAAEGGHAEAYVYGGNPVSEYDSILAAQKQAQEANRGMWGKCE